MYKNKKWVNPYISPDFYKNTTTNKDRKKKIICVEDVIVKGIKGCLVKNHTLIPVTALVVLDVGRSGNQRIEEQNFNATYCEQCDSYFMSVLEYSEIEKKGRPLCRVISEKAYKSPNNNLDYDWNTESILKAYGYSVSKQDGLTEKQRRNILSFVIENNIMSRYDCITLLEFNINIRKGRNNMEDAISKWKSDLKFLREEQTSQYSIVVRSIFRKVYR